MSFWDDFLENPPFDVMSNESGPSSDSHAVLRCGYDGFDLEELWDFGSGMTGHAEPAPLPSFPEHGGYTLCGLPIESGQNMYGPRWGVFDDHFGEGASDAALLDLHGVSCMVCRRKLMYGVSRIVRRLTSLRDSLGQDYVQNVPLIHGKEVLSRKQEGSITSEGFRLHCNVASNEINPRLVDAAEEYNHITCPDCKTYFANDAIGD